ncbi:diacylglycerol/lipid kinase family protein [Kitasatospora sp. NBC_00458]|uniref:diacylglycerol/lipid kinase family protein n=1 Tax=Kitasatospora sp. NBC_00458 TaxID=2903568 RepID=UPI002E197846
MAAPPPTVLRRARRSARLAVLCALGALVVLVAGSGPGGLLILATALIGSALTAAGTWWAVSHRGAVRALGFLLMVGAPAAVVVLYARAGLWPEALAATVLWAAAAASARSAVRLVRRPDGMRAVAGQRPSRPFLIMNPKSGGGKVGRFGLVEKAEALGARVALLDTSATVDVAALARQAVAEGADLLGVAGGDGTQARVAEVAAEHDLPFLVISAGTRNHFAMDLGLDRTDPARCLDALTDGEELRVDLGTVGGLTFVNTASFGVYAQIVQRPEYRDAKAGAALDALPDLLLGYGGHLVDARTEEEDARLDAQQALLISNNPYTGTEPVSGGGRRPRLDLGVLGVVGIRVTNAAQATRLALRGGRAAGLRVLTCRQVVVGSDTDRIPVAVDGEALYLPAPVVCGIRPGALRVLVPRGRPGPPPVRPTPEWREILSLAFTRSGSGAVAGARAAEQAPAQAPGPGAAPPTDRTG